MAAADDGGVLTQQAHLPEHAGRARYGNGARVNKAPCCPTAGSRHSTNAQSMLECSDLAPLTGWVALRSGGTPAERFVMQLRRPR